MKKLKTYLILLLVVAVSVVITACGRDPETFTVTFVGNGATTLPITSVTAEKGSTILQPLANKTGHTLIGWYREDNFNTRWDFSSDVVEQDKSLYANWQANSVTINFNSNGGSAVQAITHDFNHVITALPTPTRSGYNFVGWHLNGQLVVFPLTLTQNINLVAQWQAVANPVTIIFDSAGGSAVDEMIIESGTTVTQPDNPTKEDHVFVGWRLAGADTNFDFATPISANTTLTAFWQAVFTVSFDLNGGVYAGELSRVINHNEFVEPVEPTKEDHVFVGWRLAGADTNFDFETPITQNITLVAQWAVLHVSPEVTIVFVGQSDDTITFNIEVVDPDGALIEIYRITLWELLTGTMVDELDLDGLDEFTNLMFEDLKLGVEYSIVVFYRYELNNELGIQSNEIERTFITPADLIFEIIDDLVVHVTGVRSFAGGSITIPNYHDGLPVVKVVGFYGEFNLVNIILNDNLQIIGEKAFYNTSLTSVTIPASVTTIGLDALHGLTVILGSDWTQINSGLFIDSGLEYLILPTSVTTIASNALYDLTVILSDDWTQINSGLFTNTGLTRIIIPGSVTTIGANAFNNIATLVEVTFDGNGLLSIGANAFSGTSLVTFVLPSTLTTIGNSAFNITTLNAITLNEGLQTMGNDLFVGSIISEITLPSTLTTIGNSLTGLTVILSNNWTAVNSGLFTETGLTTIVIPGSVLTIENDAFRNITTLVTVTINHGVTTIGANAFENTSLVSIVIPGSVVTIGNAAFRGVTTLTNVTLNDGLVTIGVNAFERVSITQLITPSTLRYIEDAAFIFVSSLTSLTLNEGLLRIGALAFAATGLTGDVILPASVIDYQNAFMGVNIIRP